MSEGSVVAESSSRGRGRGRGKSRGGLGKYLRARGRGRGIGRPAEFGKRLVLEGEEGEEENEEEAAARQAKYSRRNLGTNADRYAEQEPELDSDGMSEFLVMWRVPNHELDRGAHRRARNRSVCILRKAKIDGCPWA